MNKQETRKNNMNRDVVPSSELWTDGLVCAFEFVRGHQKMFQKKSDSKVQSRQEVGNGIQREGGFVSKLSTSHVPIDNSIYLADSKSVNETFSTFEALSDDNINGGEYHSNHFYGAKEQLPRIYWRPIGWDRLSQLVQTVQVDAQWPSHLIDVIDEEDDVPIAELAAPYWKRPVGPTWWCHVDASHPVVTSWLSIAQWLHPAISIALRDESKLISERMKHLLYEVPVRVAGGLLFELLGQSAGDPLIEEDDIPIVLRSWQSQNFLITALHLKGCASNINVLGITEVQEMLIASGVNVPRTVHELIGHLICRLARWDDRLFRKYIFGAADEVELKFMNRRMHEDLHLFTVILNQEIRRLSTQVIRVKWSLHAREEIVFELLQHLKGSTTRALLEGIRKSTRAMIEEQEAVRGRLFTIQDVMQSTVRAWLQDRSLTVTHNLGIFGGCGLVLSIITGLFGINVDGIPGAEESPYAFALFSALLFFVGFMLIAIGLLYLGLKKPEVDQNVEVRKLELDELVRMFQREAESHAQVRKTVPRNIKHPAAADILPDRDGYVLIS